MSSKSGKFSRRDFIKKAGVIGIGSILSPVESITNAQENSDPNKSQTKVVSTRPFGKTGINVPILSLGGGFSNSNILLMKHALKLGVSYWAK